MLVICLLFAACSQKVEEKLTDKATDVNLISTTAAAGAEDESTTLAEETVSDKSEASSEGKEDKTEASTGVDGEELMSDEDALKEIQIFYGSLYSVEQSGSKGYKRYYDVKDNNGKDYASVTLDLSTGDIEETIADSGEKNTWNMFV